MKNWNRAACNLPKAHKKDADNTQKHLQGGKYTDQVNANWENWDQKISQLQKSARFGLSGMPV